MCGFAGFFSIRPEFSAPEIAANMGEALEHRGPDDSGAWNDPRAGIFLTFRRLSILDLTASGHQPLASQDGRWVICFNGEIYNYQSLKHELSARGHRFQGASDSEVLVEALAAWGLDATLSKLNGMFALAAWDRTQRELYLARDRAGEKPLYYGWHGTDFLFGSELKALRAHPSFDAEVNPDAVAEFMQLSCIPAPLSIYRYVHKLLPGHYLRLPATERVSDPHPICYWSAVHSHNRAVNEPPARDYVQQLAELDELLRDAVLLRMRADVPLGAFLSGGIDSSLVVAMMQQQSSRPVRTFTIGFAERAFDEAGFARRIAEHLRTEHTELYVTDTQARELIPYLPRIYDEPFADASQIPTYLVSRLARESVVVSLSGDGGDELFGGYPRYRSVHALQPLWQWLPQRGRRALGELLGGFARGPWDRRISKKLRRLAGALSSTDRAELYRALMHQWRDGEVMAHSSRLRFDSRFAQMPTGHLVQQMMWYDFLHYLGDDVLAKLDRASMAVSLEARVPFLDPRVIDFAWKLPLSSKLSVRSGKKILTDLLHKHLPRTLFDRPKMGFSLPIGPWLRTSLRPWAEELLSDSNLKKHGYFDARVIQAAWHRHLHGTADHSAQLWNALMFQSWFESGSR